MRSTGLFHRKKRCRSRTSGHTYRQSRLFRLRKEACLGSSRSGGWSRRRRQRKQKIQKSLELQQKCFRWYIGLVRKRYAMSCWTLLLSSDQFGASNNLRFYPQLTNKFWIKSDWLTLYIFYLKTNKAFFGLILIYNYVNNLWKQTNYLSTDCKITF